MTAPAPSWSDAEVAAEAIIGWYRRRLTSSDDQDWVVPEQLLALALWRVASDQHATIAKTELDGHELRYLRDAKRLLAAPLPAGLSERARLVTSVDPERREADRVICQIKSRHVVNDLNETDDGMPAHDTVGSLLEQLAQEAREITSLPAVERVHQYADAAGIALTNHAWSPTAAERALVDTVHTTLAAVPQGGPGDLFATSWLARLRQIAEAGNALRTMDTAAASTLLTQLLGAIVELVDAVTQSLSELDAAWSARRIDQRLPYWERTHMPIVLRSRIRDAEFHLSVVCATLAAAITGNVDL